jgi:hypothetical protein
MSEHASHEWLAIADLLPCDAQLEPAAIVAVLAWLPHPPGAIAAMAAVVVLACEPHALFEAIAAVVRDFDLAPEAQQSDDAIAAVVLDFEWEPQDWPVIGHVPAATAPLAFILAQAAAISGVHCAAISAVQAPLALAAVAFAPCLLAQQEEAAFAPPELAAAAVVLSLPHAKAAAEQKAVAATARARRRNCFMTNLPEGGQRSGVVPQTREASASRQEACHRVSDPMSPRCKKPPRRARASRDAVIRDECRTRAAWWPRGVHTARSAAGAVRDARRGGASSRHGRGSAWFDLARLRSARPNASRR